MERIYIYYCIVFQIEFAEQQVRRQRVTKSYVRPTDPYFEKQWNLVASPSYKLNCCSKVIYMQFNQDGGNDLRVEQAWLQGFTGCNITVSVVDDGNYVYSIIGSSFITVSTGIDFRHPDLWPNFVSQLPDK